MSDETAGWPERAADALQAVRVARPLVHCLTNKVTVNFVANGLLALGASPAMVDIPVEAGLFAGAASAVLVNLGTPGAEQRAAMLEAAAAAGSAGKPWVLDPVAVGSLPVRTELARQLCALRPTVIRGNASEIRALAGAGAGGHGVDTADSVEDACDDALRLAQATGAVVAVSGPVDVITDGRTTVRVSNGDPLLTRVTGAGCLLGAIVAAFAATTRDALSATVAACTVYEVAAELAAATSVRPGSFAVALLDALDAVDAAAITARARVA